MTAYDGAGCLMGMRGWEKWEGVYILTGDIAGFSLWVFGFLRENCTSSFLFTVEGIFLCFSRSCLFLFF